jgi:transcriptional antiterminator RfaH
LTLPIANPSATSPKPLSPASRLYRVVTPIWRRFYHLPVNHATTWDSGLRKKRSKLIEGPSRPELVAYWAALRTRVNCEKRVVACLQDLGFKAYCPKLRIEQIVRGRRVGTIRSLFATYVFVLIVGEWRAIYKIDSAIGLVRSGDKTGPSAVPDAAMEALRERKGVVKPGELRVGSLVRVIHGPCLGQIAACLQVQHTFVTTVLSLFGAERAARLARAYVETV